MTALEDRFWSKVRIGDGCWLAECLLVEGVLS